MIKYEIFTFFSNTDDYLQTKDVNLETHIHLLVLARKQSLLSFMYVHEFGIALCIFHNITYVAIYSAIWCEFSTAAQNDFFKMKFELECVHFC